MTKPSQLAREINEFLSQGRNAHGHGFKANRIAKVGFGTGASSSTVKTKREPKEQYPGQYAALRAEAARRTAQNPAGRTESERAIHPELFACKDRNGKILGTSRTVRGAMGLAPAKGYAKVQGEFTSDGTNWGVGGGRTVAVREGERWQVG